MVFTGFLSVMSQDVQWEKHLKSSPQDFLASVVVTPDEQFLVAGSSIQSQKVNSVSTVGGSKQNYGYDFHLVKLNQRGEEVWEKYFQGENQDYLSATVATREGGFLLAGTSFSSKGKDKKSESFGGADIWLVKVSENGEEEWQAAAGTGGNEKANAVVQSTDLNYFVAGSIHDKSGFGNVDAWILVLDEAGTLLREIIIGGSGIDEVKKMIPTLDGGVLLGIYSRSGRFQSTNRNTKYTGGQNKDERAKVFFTGGQNDDQSNSAPGSILKNTIPFITYSKETENEGEGDFWVVKLDKDGNKEWEKNFGGNNEEQIKTLALAGKGYFVAGESNSKNSGSKKSGLEEGTDIWLIALDQYGNELYQKSYSLGKRDVLMSMSAIWDAKATETKGILLGGYTAAEKKSQRDDETFWMLQVDNNGTEIWRKYIEGKSQENEERLVAANILSDGYLLAGTSAKELGKENWKVVKLGDKSIKELNIKPDIKIYPNPVDDYCYVEIGFAFKEATLEVYDMAGRMVQTLKTKNTVTKINTQNLVQGAYLVVAKTESKSANAKIIKK